ncbi:MAG: hypothetical protein CME70_02520 [Halobacteriovorax sp.]|nr:hypothetical protein [Halobacteriovorax sp.]|tara:strand:- start:14105 stop:15127 length:1023 start_codon:yes stop_codon:yes gene_type:complete
MQAELVDHINKFDDSFWEEKLKRSYTQFFLYHNKTWIHEFLRAEDDLLIPKDKSELVDFINKSSHLISHNTYLVNILKITPKTELEYLGESHLTQLIVFAYSLDKINSLMRENLELADFLVKHFHRKRKENNFYRLNNILRIIKFHSIQYPLIKFIKDHKKGRVAKSSGKFILAANIFEAFLVDLFKGYFKNAFSCIPLMIFSPNFKALHLFKRFFKLGSDSRISKDGNGFEMISPEQKKWSDLYQSWNFTFVSQFKEAPYLLIKLIIPSVTDYEKIPAGYMHTRITALFLCLNYVDFASNHCVLETDLDKLKPFSRTLIKEQGKINYNSGKDYFRSVLK